MHAAGLLAVAGMVSLSAVLTKEAQIASGGALVALTETGARAPVADADPQPQAPAILPAVDPLADRPAPAPAQDDPSGAQAPVLPDNFHAGESDLRWFSGRPVRPAGVIRMKVTAYAPCARSCGEFADGQTASLHSVFTNGMRLVAADSTVLPLGSMITVPGYAQGEVVPVLDRGGAIKGNRLDLLFPTHEAALQWGVREIDVIVWEYADGKPAGNWRDIRDGK